MSANRMDPLGMISLRDAIDRLFGVGFSRGLLGRRGMGVGEDQWIPVNMFELPEGVMIVAPMPGLQADDVELSVAGTILTLRGRRTPGQEDREYMVKEWDYGPYSRTIDLPFEVDTDHIIATLDNGVLTVNLRKSEAAMPKRIHIRSGAERSATGGEVHASPQGIERERESESRH
ncbi:MAG TPA: Hsp20/alpha crystallin family protein [Chloroflexota bacterium]|nr:Hsp20/alpha crystallin family protein [Chloroflexota bacterium]HEX2987034.1 Hsp20/alpha crystallin family protein [Chloroflexota bacterium]